MADKDDILAEMREQEYLGVWWIPNGEENPHRVTGILHVVEGERLELQVLGSLSVNDNDESLDNYPVVNGASHGLNRFTIFNMSVTRRVSNKFESDDLVESNLWGIEAWVGRECYARKEDISFFNLSSGMFGLSAWHNINPFSVSFNWDEHATSLGYKRPDNVLLYEDASVTISIGYTWRGPGQSVGQTEASVSHEAQIVIQSKNGKLAYYGDSRSYECYLNTVRTILGLMTGAPAPLYNCTGLLRKYELPQDGQPFVPEIILKRTWRRDMPKLSDKGLSPYDVLVPYKFVRNIKEVVGRFFSLPKFVRDYAGHLVYLNGCDSKMTQGALSELVYMFEGIHRELHGAKPRLILSFIDELTRLASVFPYLNDDEMGLSLSVFIKKRRDNYSHANPDDYHAEIRLFMFAKMWMHQFITAMILVECGMDPEDLHKIFSNNHLYNNIAKELPPLIRDHRRLYPNELENMKKTLGDSTGSTPLTQ